MNVSYDPRYYLGYATHPAVIAGDVAFAPKATRSMLSAKCRGIANSLAYAIDPTQPAAPPLRPFEDGNGGVGGGDRVRFATTADVTTEIARLRAVADQIDAIA